MFHGTLTALVTPFVDEPGPCPKIDFETLESLIEWQLQCGVTGLVLCGTTGEAATLEVEERLQIFRRTKEIVKGRVPLIAGTGSNNTHHSVELTRKAKALGMDGCLLVSPYYNKPTQEGLYHHFRTVAVEGGLPAIVYNIPGRTAVDISGETFARLAHHSEIVGVKEASGSVGKLMDIAEAVQGKMAIFAGDDNATFLTMSVGGKGVITASANVIPREMVRITDAMARGDFKEGCQAQIDALPAIRSLFLETNPAPAKAALAMMGRIPSDRLRLPLVPVKEETRKVLRQTILQGEGR